MGRRRGERVEGRIGYLVEVGRRGREDKGEG